MSPGLWLGGALSYTYGDNDFDHGEGDSSLLAFTAYASRLFENGFYLDFTGKVGRMKNSFDIRSSGDYHTNAVSVSAEAGWRFDVMKNVFFEPQVEVWYGHVFDAQYETSTGVDVDQASTDSLVGRAGFRLGLECPNNRGSAFIKASCTTGKAKPTSASARAASLPERSRRTWAARGMSTASAPTSIRPSSSISGLNSSAATAAKSIPTTAPRSACATPGKAGLPLRQQAICP